MAQEMIRCVFLASAWIVRHASLCEKEFDVLRRNYDFEMHFTVSGRACRSATLQLVFNLGLLYDYDCSFRPRRLALSTGRTKDLLVWFQKKAKACLSQYLAGQVS